MSYFCEKSRNINNEIYARDLDGFFYTIINGSDLDSMATCLSFRPDNKKIYGSYQSDGITFEIKRDDGIPYMHMDLY